MRSLRRVPPSIVPPAVKGATFLLSLGLPLAALADRAITASSGIDLTGVWSIDRERSDDPTKTQETNRKDAKDAIHVRVGGGLGGLGGFGGIGGTEDLGDGPPASTASRKPTRKHEHPFTASERIEIIQLPKSVDLKFADYYLSCTSTAKIEISLPHQHSAERTCGWEGDEFVVEVFDSKGFTRVDRYAMGADKTLGVETTITSDHMPKREFKIVYARSELD